MGVAECTALSLEKECDDLVGAAGVSWGLERDGGFIVPASKCAWASSNFSKMLYTSSKVYESPNFAKTCYKTYAWSVGVPSNERKYWWETSRNCFEWCDALGIFLEFEKPLIEHLEGFILLPREGGELQNFFRTFDWKFQLKNSKEFPIGLAKASASVVGGMFVVAITNMY